MSFDVLIVTPAAEGSQRGNRVTAERWATHLQALGHEVTVAERWSGELCDVLIALHARRSAAAVAGYRAAFPEGPLVLVLTGTDLYQDIHSDADAQRSLALADRLVVLHPAAVDDVPRHLRGKVRPIVQSVDPRAVADPGRDDAADEGWQVCVLGHLREVKDPFRAAAAARLLPAESAVRVVHLGAALSEDMAERARSESEGNPRYAWRGELPHAEAMAVLAQSRLHVLTSRMEGGANALCEAIACGVPTLSTRIAGSIGLLGADYPGFFPVGDAEALAQLLRRAETDAAFYATLRALCRERQGLVAPEREREALAALLGELTGGSFAEDVRVGLTSEPKHLRCRYFYDRRGSELFEAICALPEYYVTRAEREILTERAALLPAHFDEAVTLFELGSGSGVKTRLIIEAFLDAGHSVTYVPVDISRAALEGSTRELQARYPSLRVEGIAGEYQAGLDWLGADSARQTLVLWLGSNVGNFDREGAARFLSAVGSAMTERDRLLLGVDLRKEPAVLEAAYDDAQGVTAEFNKNLLVRINRELGGAFPLDAFTHSASYDVAEGRVSMHLICRGARSVAIEGLGIEVSFRDGEAIHTEDSYKYSPAEIDALARASGFAITERWQDAGGRFSLSLQQRVGLGQ